MLTGNRHTRNLKSLRSYLGQHEGCLLSVENLLIFFALCMRCVQLQTGRLKEDRMLSSAVQKRNFSGCAQQA